MGASTKGLLLSLALIFPLDAKAEVNMKDGSFFQTWIDFKIPAKNGSLEIERTYNSRSIHNGLFGFGWCSNLEKRLMIIDSIHIKLQDCKTDFDVSFTEKQPGQFIADLGGLNPILLRASNYSFLASDNLTYSFDRNGRLLTISESKPKSGTPTHMDLEYDFVGGLKKIRSSSGVEISTRTNSLGKITELKPKSGASIKFDYSDQNLISVDIAVSPRTHKMQRYNYDTFHNLTQIENSDRSKEFIAYDDERDWVLRYQDVSGCVESYSFFQIDNFHHSSALERKCGSEIQRTARYEFSYKNREDGVRFLDRMSIRNSVQSFEVSYNPYFGTPIRIVRNGRIILNNHGGLDDPN